MSIQVKNIAGLDSYGTSIHSFGGRFEEAASDTVREFNTSLEGEKAEAINAFFEKLNTIQTTVFKDAPKDVMTYGQQVFTFTGELKGLGFSSLAFTDDESITSLTKSLEVQQRDVTAIVKSKVIKVVQQAVDVMGEGDATISNFDSTVDSLISEEVKARKETHEGIKTAHETLEKAVSNSADRFETLTAMTQNAKAITSIPALNILDAIQRGDLRQDNVNYLDAAYTSDDVEIIKVLISESRYKTKKDFFEKLARAKVDDASLPTTMLVANRLEKAAEKDAPLFSWSQAYQVEPQESEEGECFSFSNAYRSKDSYQTALMGLHQADNAGLALHLCDLYCQLQSLPLLTKAEVERALLAAVWPGRLERISDQPLILLDGAHNPHALRSLAATLDQHYPTYKKHILFACIQTKALDDMVELLQKIPKAAISLTAFADPRSFSKESMQALAEQQGLSYKEWPDYLADYLAVAHESDELLLITGSLYFLAQVRKSILENSKLDLAERPSQSSK